MTKQKIIDLMKEKASSILFFTFTQGEEDFADALLAMFEQEKKEIFRAVYHKLLGSGHSYLIKELADEYGVEL